VPPASTTRPGPHAARFQDRDLDAERGYLLGQHLGEAADRPLGRLVGGQAGGGETAADRGDLDDAAAALGAQDGQCRLGDVHDAEQVGVDLRPEVVQGDVLDRGEVGVPGVVDHHVDAAERRDARGDGRLGGGGVGHVERDGQDPGAVASGEVGHVGGLARGGDEAVPGRQDGLGDLAAEAAAASGQEENSRHGTIVHRRCANYTTTMR
jgi:hypothetical protein